MFVRFCVLLLSLVLASCQTGPLVGFGTQIGVNVAHNVGSTRDPAKLRNCSGPDASDWLCRKDAKKLAGDVNARVCSPDDTPCRYIPIEEAASFERFCFRDSMSQDCWFQDPNT